MYQPPNERTRLIRGNNITSDDHIQASSSTSESTSESTSIFMILKEYMKLFSDYIYKIYLRVYLWKTEVTLIYILCIDIVCI